MNNLELVPQKELDILAKYNAELKDTAAALLEVAKNSAGLKFPTAGSGTGATASSRPKPDAQVTAIEKELNRLYEERIRLEARMTEVVQKRVKENAVLRESERRAAADAKISAKEMLAVAGSMDEMAANVERLAFKLRSIKMKSPEWDAVAKELAETRAELTKTEMSVGQFGRNVGNYASGFSPLSFQVQQLAREMPSLANSLPQFFLAISNNLPMFGDEVAKARKAYDAYKKSLADGIDVPKVKSPIKQIMSSLLSWQTVLVVGITVLTLYGKEIVQWAKSLLTGKDAALDAAGAMKKVSEAMEVSDFGQKMANFKRLSDLYAEIGDNAKAKEQFLKDYREEIDDTGVSVKNLVDADNLFIKNSAAYIEALKLRTQANAAQSLAEKEYAKQFEAQVKADEKIAKQGIQDRIDYFSSLPEAAKTVVGTDPLSGRNITVEDNILMSLQKEADAIRKTEYAAAGLANTYNDIFTNLDVQAQEIYTKAGFIPLETGNGGVNLSALNRERDALKDIAAAEFERDKAVQREIINSDSMYASTMDRYAATQKLYALEISEIEKLAETQKQNLIARNMDENKGRTEEEATKAVANQLEAVELVKNNKIIALRLQLTKDLQDLDNEVVENAIRNVEREVQARQRAIDQAESDELAALSAQYSGVLSNQTEYEEKRLAVTRKYADERQLAELAALKEQLALMQADPYIDEGEKQKMIDLQQQIADAEVEINKTKNERLIEDDERTREKQIKLLGRIKDAFGELLDFIGEVSSLSTQKQLDDLDAQQEAAEKHAEDEQARIERLAEAGAISEEQKNARIALSNQQLEEKQKQIDRQRAEAEKKQAILDVMIKTAQAIMAAAASAPFPWNLIPIGFATALGGVQLAAVNAARYAEGTPEGGHRGGLAWVGDGGRSEMVIMSGKAYKSPAVPTLIDLPKGAEVLPDYNQAVRDFAIANALTPIRQSDVPRGRESAPYNDTMVLARLGDANHRLHKLTELTEMQTKAINRQGSDRRFKEFRTHSKSIV